MLESLIEAVKHVGHGFKYTFKDGVYWTKLVQKKKASRTIAETRDFKRISQNLAKMVPFSSFVLVPFMEIALPPYMILFPNAIPEGFVTAEQKADKKVAMAKAQSAAHTDLSKVINKFLIEMNVDVRTSDKSEKKAAVINGSMNKMNLNEIDSDTLVKIGDFLNMNIITGSNIISTLFRWTVNLPFTVANLGLKIARSKKTITPKNWLFNYKFKLNMGPLDFLKKKLLLG